MAHMVFGDWQSDLGRDKRPTNHKLAIWPKAICGVKLSVISEGFLTTDDQLVTCKRCLAKMKREEISHV